MSWFLSALSVVCGITYFIAWSASFYPQVYLNWKRKSVVGFSFDYLNYNMLGFTCYTIYNCGLFFGPMIQREYEDKFGTSQPIQPSDVLFTCHALLLCSVQCSQCFIYDVCFFCFFLVLQVIKNYKRGGINISASSQLFWQYVGGYQHGFMDFLQQ